MSVVKNNHQHIGNYRATRKTIDMSNKTAKFPITPYVLVMVFTTDTGNNTTDAHNPKID